MKVATRSPSRTPSSRRALASLAAFAPTAAYVACRKPPGLAVVPWLVPCTPVPYSKIRLICNGTSCMVLNNGYSSSWGGPWPASGHGPRVYLALVGRGQRGLEQVLHQAQAAGAGRVGTQDVGLPG